MRLQGVPRITCTVPLVLTLPVWEVICSCRWHLSLVFVPLRDVVSILAGHSAAISRRALDDSMALRCSAVILALASLLTLQAG
jgi:hypothetical protein